jgi:hypothetical protein
LLLVVAVEDAVLLLAVVGRVESRRQVGFLFLRVLQLL